MSSKISWQDANIDTQVGGDYTGIVAKNEAIVKLPNVFPETRCFASETQLEGEVHALSPEARVVKARRRDGRTRKRPTRGSKNWVL